MKIGETIAVVICAGGESKRMGGIKKEYQRLEKDKPATVLETAAWNFITTSTVEYVYFVAPPGDKTRVWDMLPEEFNLSSQPVIQIVEGGCRRQESVFNALRALKDWNPDYVLIHDGARPWVSKDLISRVINAVKKHGAAIPVLPLTETPKIYENGFIVSHLKRANTGAAQTPQGFVFSKILEAHEKAALTTEEFTDDAEIWGKYFGQVAIVDGEPENRKITFVEDLK